MLLLTLSWSTFVNSMGIMSVQDPAQQERSVALRLMDQKELIEAQIEHQQSILRLNDSTMQSPLLDPEGFPRADIDIVSVRNVNFTSLISRPPVFKLFNTISIHLNCVILSGPCTRNRASERPQGDHGPDSISFARHLPS